MPYCTLSPPFPHKRGVILANFSTFGIGGGADLFAVAHSSEEMREMVQYAHTQQLRFIVIGKGSNVLFDDRGFKGLVILNRIEGISQHEGQFVVGSGVSFPRLGTLTAKRGYHGLEFAAGIPATVGGAIYMNAGAGGQETFDPLLSVDYVTEEGVLCRYLREELTWAYRTSCFQAWAGAIVGATFGLTKQEGTHENQKTLVSYRLETQPYGMKSAGCVFRNPEGISAGRAIEESGLKGLRVGGVSVSVKHANFIVNDQGGTAADVKELVRQIKEKILKEKGISLHEEIRYIAYDV